MIDQMFLFLTQQRSPKFTNYFSETKQPMIHILLEPHPNPEEVFLMLLLHVLRHSSNALKTTVMNFIMEHWTLSNRLSHVVAQLGLTAGGMGWA